MCIFFVDIQEKPNDGDKIVPLQKYILAPLAQIKQSP